MGRFLIYLMAFLTAVSALTGCRTHSDTSSTSGQALTQQATRTDTAVKVIVRVDSVYRHDSTTVHVSSKNDTVFVVKEFYHNYYRGEKQDRKEEKKKSEAILKEEKKETVTEKHEVKEPPRVAAFFSDLLNIGLFVALIYGVLAFINLVKKKKQ